MKLLTKKILSVLACFFIFSVHSFAFHVVGGDITVRWLNGNNFEVTLNFFRDCSSSTGFDNTINVGVYHKSNDALQQVIILSNPIITPVSLGDYCYNPGTCMEKAVYKTQVAIPNSTNGYYLSYHRCCRNLGITNIINPDVAGYIMYCEIPNPSMRNSTPTFNTIPDGYMCLNYPNTDNFSCTDIDGDQLVYSFTTPLSCSATNICSDINPNPGAGPKPYGNIAWASGYSLSNQMGDPAMAVNPTTGIVTTTPPFNGMYVFCVKVEEYRAGVKIGEIRRDFQFQILGCSILNVSYSPAPEICSGNSTTLVANGASPAFTYSWNPGGQTTSSIVVSYTANGTYNYTVTATNGLCVSKANATVIINENPTQSYVTPTNILCNGGTGSALVTPVGGTSPYTYNWTTVPVQTSNPATNLIPGTYSVTVKDKNGCTSSETVTITQPSVLSSSLSSTNVSCYSVPNGSATVFVSGGTIGSGYTFSWNTSPVQTTATATGLSAGNYTATVTDAQGCITTQTVTISQPTAVTLNTQASGFSCAGTSPNGGATATVGGGTPGYSYLWKPGNKTTSSISNLIAGTYSVTVTDAKGCSLSQSVTITSSTKPDAMFKYEPIISCEGVMMKFTDESSPAPIASWSWNFGDGSTSSEQNPSHAFDYDAGYYNVTLIVSKPPCYDTIKTNVKISDMFSYAEFKAANIFTPNNDGDNDCFTPALIGKGADTLKACVSLVVFDRWGVKMFESVGSNNCWNGNNKNDSKPAVDGVYFYVSTLGKTTIKGYVTLIRNKPD